MEKKQIIEKIKKIRLIPVIRASSPEEALQIVQAVYTGGISIIEITMTVPNAISVLKRVHQEYGEKVMLGAGTILNLEQANAAISAGAQFIVSPALIEEIIPEVHRAEKVVIPGALTPTEIVRAWTAGADMVKIFPCGNLGGPPILKH
ncbi:MAG: bifunctional 4-hydroxy-2-oxoglutarate aldolase/2-dehydro-3-deoxy-phosphogluconate aldolase [bacterium]|nr:bifunctional 4-hydroxy-2-oxoglutarate aldolase/2-dehydro-3-deoxy-phosphogluconate aldolase [bacterium]